MASAEKPRPARKRIWRARSWALLAGLLPYLRSHTARARAEFAVLQALGGGRVERRAVLAQFLADAQVAVARGCAR